MYRVTDGFRFAHEIVLERFIYGWNRMGRGMEGIIGFICPNPA